MSEEIPPDSKDDHSESTNLDAFAPENIGFIHFIQLARLYDVGMALLTASDPNAAKTLLDIHSRGDLLGGAPTFSQVFMSDNQDLD